MFCMVMHHICLYFFCQFFYFHTVSGTFHFYDMFRVQKNICPNRAITGILTDFSPYQRIKRFQTGIQKMLYIILILNFQCCQLFFLYGAAFMRRAFQKSFQKQIKIIEDCKQTVLCRGTVRDLFKIFDDTLLCSIQIISGLFIRVLDRKSVV